MTTKREELTMHVMYEPNRFSDTYLTDAYEALAPTLKLTIPTHPTMNEQVTVDTVIDDCKGERL